MSETLSVLQLDCVELNRLENESGIQLANRMRLHAAFTGKTIVTHLGKEAQIIAHPGETPILR